MARIRTIKPDFFKHSGLFDAERETGLPLRLAYAGLWVCCDREGRFKWRPRELKLDALPFDDCDFSRVLDALESRGFLVRYEALGESFGYVPTWHKHQFVNNREGASKLPIPPLIQTLDASTTRESREHDACDSRLEGKGKEGKGKGINASSLDRTNTDLVGLDPAMVCAAVMDDLRISGRELRIVLDAVCHREMARGMPGEEVRAALVDAYARYQAAKPRLCYTVPAEKFFGQWWHNPAGWPWKDGESPAAAQPAQSPTIDSAVDASRASRKREFRAGVVQ